MPGADVALVPSVTAGVESSPEDVHAAATSPAATINATPDRCVRVEPVRRVMRETYSPEGFRTEDGVRHRIGSWP